ncbi:MAG: hypothetical protein KIT31_30695 [Deltaproteobacteria bacterium]|nr:hypothetical protein [Deltaproteobacteria bacterium]
MRMTSSIAAAVVFVAACDKPVSSAPTPTTPTTPAAPSKPPAKDPDKTKMSEFKHRAAIHAYAAKVLKVSVDQVEGGPQDEATAKIQTHTAGKVWAFTVWLRPGDHSREARAWITEDGTLVDAAQNLGILAGELGLWKPGANLDEVGDKLAEKLAWSYGMNHRVIAVRENGMTPPEVKLAPDGSGTIVFFTAHRETGPGGAGGGPEAFTRNDIALTAKHEAKLTKSSK